MNILQSSFGVKPRNKPKNKPKNKPRNKLQKKAKKYKIRITKTIRGRRVYKTINELKKQIKRKVKRRKLKYSKFGVKSKEKAQQLKEKLKKSKGDIKKRQVIIKKAINRGKNIDRFLNILVLCHGQNSDPNPQSINYGFPENTAVWARTVDPDPLLNATYEMRIEDLPDELNDTFDIVRSEFCFENIFFLPISYDDETIIYSEENINHTNWDKINRLLKIGGEFQISENYINKNIQVYELTWIQKGFRRSSRQSTDNFGNTIIHLIKIRELV